MILFKPYHVFPIVSEDPVIRKTETRRTWNQDRAKVGAIHQCNTRFYEPGFAKVEILDVYQQPLGQMTEESARHEGGYTLLEYARLWDLINKQPLDPLKEVHVIEMRCVEINLGATELEEYENIYRTHMATLRGRIA